MFSMERIFGAVFSGFACKAYAVALGVFIACQTHDLLSAAMAGARAGLTLAP